MLLLWLLLLLYWYYCLKKYYLETWPTHERKYQHWWNSNKKSPVPPLTTSHHESDYNKQGRPCKRHCLDGSICSSKTCMCSGLMVSSQMYKLPRALTQPHTVIATAFLNFALITILMVLFLFCLEDTMFLISKHNLKCGLVRPRDSFPREVGSIFGSCWYTVYSESVQTPTLSTP